LVQRNGAATKTTKKKRQNPQTPRQIARAPAFPVSSTNPWDEKTRGKSADMVRVEIRKRARANGFRETRKRVNRAVSRGGRLKVLKCPRSIGSTRVERAQTFAPRIRRLEIPEWARANGALESNETYEASDREEDASEFHWPY
jgi:hypothetical protein